MEKEIYIIRHGQTDYNKRRIIQGRGVNSHLNEKGRQQATAFYEAYKHIKFDEIFTSSLIRTQQTVEPFINIGYSYTPHEGLDEIDWGVHEGKPGNPALAKAYLAITSKWKNGDLHEKIPEGESPLELQARQIQFIEETLKPLAVNKVLICSHGRAIRILLCTLTGLSLSQMDTFEHYNTCLYKVHYRNGAFEIVLHNSTEHLEKG